MAGPELRDKVGDMELRDKVGDMELRDKVGDMKHGWSRKREN